MGNILCAFEQSLFGFEKIFENIWAKFLQIKASLGKCFGLIHASPNWLGQICTCLNLKRNTALQQKNLIFFFIFEFI